MISIHMTWCSKLKPALRNLCLDLYLHCMQAIMLSYIRVMCWGVWNTGSPMEGPLQAYRITSPITKLVKCQEQHVHSTARFPNGSANPPWVEYTQWTQQYTHTPAIIQCLNSAPVKQHLKSTSHHRAVPPCVCDRERRGGGAGRWWGGLLHVMRCSKRWC